MNECVICFVSSLFTSFLLLLNFQLTRLRGKRNCLPSTCSILATPFLDQCRCWPKPCSSVKTTDNRVYCFWFLVRLAGFEICSRLCFCSKYPESSRVTFNSPGVESTSRCFSLSWVLCLLHQEQQQPQQEQQEQPSGRTGFSCGLLTLSFMPQTLHKGL